VIFKPPTCQVKSTKILKTLVVSTILSTSKNPLLSLWNLSTSKLCFLIVDFPNRLHIPASINLCWESKKMMRKKRKRKKTKKDKEQKNVAIQH
jgi:hypothetical protein